MARGARKKGRRKPATLKKKTKNIFKGIGIGKRGGEVTVESKWLRWTLS
jgi:hypothetical protein